MTDTDAKLIYKSPKISHVASQDASKGLNILRYKPKPKQTYSTIKRDNDLKKSNIFVNYLYVKS